MYIHRPDILSFTFGVFFTLTGLAFAIDPSLVAQMVPFPLFPLFAITVGLGVIGNLLMGDVHRAAGLERAGREDGHDAFLHGLPHDIEAVILPAEDLAFGSPLDAETLDLRFRETFGEAHESPEGTGPVDSGKPTAQ